jgi:GT2 family glycosyltransferase
MNPDCSIDQKSFRLLMKALDEHEKVAVVSPVVFQGKGGEPNLKFRDYSKGFRAGEARGLNYNKQLPDIIFEACLDGACFLVESNRFDQIGAFDEHLFMYSEEDDISMRLALSDFSKITVSDARAEHIGGASSSNSVRVELRKKYHQKWSSYYILRKYEGWPLSKWGCVKTLSAAPVALLTYSLLLKKKYLIKWLGWTLASIDFLFSSKIFRRI